MSGYRIATADAFIRNCLRIYTRYWEKYDFRVYIEVSQNTKKIKMA